MMDTCYKYGVRLRHLTYTCFVSRIQCRKKCLHKHRIGYRIDLYRKRTTLEIRSAVKEMYRWRIKSCSSSKKRVTVF